MLWLIVFVALLSFAWIVLVLAIMQHGSRLEDREIAAHRMRCIDDECDCWNWS